MTDFPIWQLISTESLKKLAEYQYAQYGEYILKTLDDRERLDNHYI